MVLYTIEHDTNEKEKTTNTLNKMEEYHRYNVEWKKLYIKYCTAYDSTYLKFRKSLTESVIIKVQIVAIFIEILPASTREFSGVLEMIQVVITSFYIHM